MIDFYSNKKNTVPRFFYRNYLKYIRTNNVSNEEAIKTFSDLLNLAQKSDFLKFTWNLPEYFKKHLDEEILEGLENLLKEKREKKSKKLLKHVFPHVADEFSLSHSFLSSAFDKINFPTINDSESFFSIGSCFARNFTDYLKSKKINASNFPLAEDLNSPGSNAVLLKCINFKNEKDLQKYLKNIISMFWDKSSQEEKNKVLQSNVKEILNLKEKIQNSNKIIITLGNTVDYYFRNKNKEEIAPKFISLSMSEEINERTLSYKRMKKAGCYIRMSNFNETKNYILNIYNIIRKFSPNIDILFSVSPVPIDSVLGIEDKLKMNAIEIDCVSKSTIRAALYEVLLSSKALLDKKVFYLPSYEIVRWIAPVASVPIFGVEDAASRHVSNIVLNSVCDFIYKQSKKN
ncbi:MAG: hypothetical protein CFH16_00079 [Alphaproteobacteria bacterium MarineAlpha5_Bin6]|nr:MAG: hypothetical protein CFH17_00156 [Alphaproteobacteria bacterium MarineAlpha5_Bin7]PPR54902.1 MAG: hypothetical protein CFH16_00079 [Alphaproteobacteria bacterium MarineAlpha5_Bin6]